MFFWPKNEMRPSGDSLTPAYLTIYRLELMQESSKIVDNLVDQPLVLLDVSWATTRQDCIRFTWVRLLAEFKTL